MMGNRINIVVKDGSKMLKYGQKVKIDESFDGSFTYSVCEMNVKCQFIKKTNQAWIALFKQIKIPNCEITILSNYEIYIAYVYQLTNSQLANKALSSPIIVSGESNSMKYEMIFSFNPENVYKTLNKIKKLQQKNRRADKGHFENHYIVTNPKPYQGGSFSGK